MMRWSRAAIASEPSVAGVNLRSIDVGQYGSAHRNCPDQGNDGDGSGLAADAVTFPALSAVTATTRSGMPPVRRKKTCPLFESRRAHNLPGPHRGPHPNQYSMVATVGSGPTAALAAATAASHVRVLAGGSGDVSQTTFGPAATGDAEGDADGGAGVDGVAARLVAGLGVTTPGCDGGFVGAGEHAAESRARTATIPTILFIAVTPSRTCRPQTRPRDSRPPRCRRQAAWASRWVSDSADGWQGEAGKG